jgi:hypothetical protein
LARKRINTAEITKTYPFLIDWFSALMPKNDKKLNTNPSSPLAILEKTRANKYRATASRKETNKENKVKTDILSRNNLEVIGQIIDAKFIIVNCIHRSIPSLMD